MNGECFELAQGSGVVMDYCSDLGEQQKSKELLVSVSDLIYNDKQCNLVRFQDLTKQRRLEKAEIQIDSVNLLCASVSHEMKNPI